MGGEKELAKEKEIEREWLDKIVSSSIINDSCFLVQVLHYLLSV